jgi:O-antigen ligase
MSKILGSLPIDGSPVFLQKWVNFLAVVAVLSTAVFGWFFPNTWSLILLLLCRLLDGKPLTNLKNAFTNKLFLAYFVFFVIDAAGFLHTHDMAAQGKIVSKEATLLVIAFVICAGEFGNAKTYKRLFTAYSLILLAASLYCLYLAWGRYQTSKDVYDFFYHALTAPISQNAVFFSVYMLFGIIFLLSPYGEPAIGGLSEQFRKVLRYSLLVFFLGMMVLLSSRMMLILTPLILVNIIYRRFSYRKRKLALLGLGILLIFAIGAIVTSKNNFLRWRFEEIKEGNLAVIHQQKFDPSTHFSSWDSRLLQWRYALEILDSNRAWIVGVSPGDSQDLLDQKYIHAHMYIGDPAEGPHRHNRGFLGFNFHDQFIETLVQSGLIGLTALVTIFVLLFAKARETGVREAWFVLLVTLIFFIPEAPITLQQGVFLFCWFPLLATSLPKTQEAIPSNGEPLVATK